MEGRKEGRNERRKEGRNDRPFTTISREWGWGIKEKDM